MHMFLWIFSYYLSASKRILLFDIYYIVSDLKLFKINFFFRKDSAYYPIPGAKYVIEK